MTLLSWYITYPRVQCAVCSVCRKRGVAAILLEPLQGERGIIPGTKEFFATARHLCDDCWELLMIYEVKAGMGRSGVLWGHENLGVEPGVFTSAKALGGGMPIGALLARREAANVLVPGTYASRYGGNTLACVTGLAVAQNLSDHDVLENVKERGAQLSAGLGKLAEKYLTILAETRGRGLLKDIIIHDDAVVTAGQLVGDVMAEGLLLVAAGPSVVKKSPPLIVSEEEINQALDLFKSLQRVCYKTAISYTNGGIESDIYL